MSDGTTGRRPCTALAAIGELTSTVSNSTLVNTLQAASSSERPNFFKEGDLHRRSCFLGRRGS
jgi:hypothetical protein